MAHKLAAITLATLLSQVAWADGGAPVTVSTVTLAARQAGSVFQFDGVIQPVLQSTVAAQVPGNIVSRAVKAGDAVKAGQVLAQIDSRDTQAALDMRQAEVNQAQAQLQNAKLQWERSQSLRAQGFISAAALDSAQAQWRAAQASVSAAQAGRHQAALANGFATVVAPFDGRVLATHAEVGDLAAPGRPVLTLYSPNQMRAVVQMPASQSDALRKGLTAEVSTTQGWIKPSKITPLPGADPVSQTVEWRLDLPTNAMGLIPGQTVQVRWATGQVEPPQSSETSGPLTAPTSAVVRRGELTAVYVVRNEHFVLQAVRAGLPLANGSIALWSGVKAGDRIATDAVRAGLAGATPASK